MKTIVWIDVGTHDGQEFQSVFGPTLTYFGIRAFRRFLGSRCLGRGQSPSASVIWKLFVTRRAMKKLRNLFYIALVDANAKLLRNSVYQKADAVFCVALANIAGRGAAVGKLFLVNNDTRGHGSSVFRSKQNIDEGNYLPSVIVNTDIFAEDLSSYLSGILGDYKIILRVNCEGAEDDVIYSFHRVFSGKLAHVFGSLKDVLGVKGEEADRALVRYMRDANIEFTAFSSDINTWANAHEKIYALLMQSSNA